MSQWLRRYLSDPDAEEKAPLKFRCAFHNTVYDVLKERGYEETENELEWDIFWCDKEWIHDVFDTIHLNPQQRVNHFRNHYELTRKDLLVKNLKRAKRQAEREGRWEDAAMFSSLPDTFVLPQEYSLFVEEFKRCMLADKEAARADRGPRDRRLVVNKNWWIMKPVGKSQGKGIFIFDKLSQISDWKLVPEWLRQKRETEEKGKKRQNDEVEESRVEPYVVQRYLENPLLIGGKKFDLRIYVLVVSYSPLVVWMYRSGFARFSTTRFSMDKDELENQAVHLTNVAVQKTQENYNAVTGGKWELQPLKLYLASIHGQDKVDRLFYDIESVVISSLLSVQKVMIQDKHCFELYGYDVIVDDFLQPWLLEVNASPSLTASTAADYELKFGLLDDALTVLDLEHSLPSSHHQVREEDQVDPSSLVTQVGGFDLLYRQGCGPQRFGPPATATFSAYLGTHNGRTEQLKQLARSLRETGDRKREEARRPLARARTLDDLRQCRPQRRAAHEDDDRRRLGGPLRRPRALDAKR